MTAEPRSRAGDDCVLPPEIWREILSRVPVKSILRCRSVCKSWYSLVSCPKFISDYTTRNRNNPNRLLLQLRHNREHVYSFSTHDESFTEFREHHNDDSPGPFRGREHDEVPETFLGRYVSIVGSCNGLICLGKREFVDDVKVITFVIWNPTIRKVVELSSRPSCSIPGHDSCFGFGFDSKTGDYKVLSTHSGSLGFGTKNCVCSCIDANANMNMCQVFDMRKGVWRGISPPEPSRKIWDGISECYLNGVVHWTGYRHNWSSDRIILSFDMSDEVFREIKMPDCAELISENRDDRPMESRTVTLGGLLHVMVWTWEWNHVDDMNEDCSVWAMKEYGVTESWTKLFNIDLQIARVYRYEEPYKFRLWEKVQFLMVRDLPENIQELVLYNTESRNHTQLFSLAKCILDTCLFEESLVLM